MVEKAPVQPAAVEADLEERLAGLQAALTPLFAKFELTVVPQVGIDKGLIVANIAMVSTRKKPVTPVQAPAPQGGGIASA